MKAKPRRYLIKKIIGLQEYLDKVLNTLLIQENKGLHPKHDLTQYWRFFADNVNPKDKVLDIGCGIGLVAHKVAQKANQVTGIDLDKRSLKFAREHFPEDNLQFIYGDATNYPFKDQYDVIILSNVLEHIEEREKFLKDIRHLAPKMLIRVPMLNRDWLPLYKKKIGLFYFCDKTHYIEYTLKSFQKEMEAAGLKLKKYSVQFGEIWAELES